MTEALAAIDGGDVSFGLDAALETLDGIEAGSTSFDLRAGIEVLGGIGGLMRFVTEDEESGGRERFGELACDEVRLGAGSSINMPLIGSNR